MSVNLITIIYTLFFCTCLIFVKSFSTTKSRCFDQCLKYVAPRTGLRLSHETKSNILDSLILKDEYNPVRKANIASVMHRNTESFSDHVNKEVKFSKWIAKALSQIICKCLLLLSIAFPMTAVQDAKAIGSLYELKDQKFVLQDVSFNVVDIDNEKKFFDSLFQGTCKLLRSTTDKDSTNIATFGFGPDTFNKPKDFYPGVSYIQLNGGHATVSIKSKNIDGISEYFERGNGLQYIKYGNDVIRLSKAIEAGMTINYAYGWIEGESPSGIPSEVVVGIARDPIMAIGLRVSNLEESLEFFTSELGMKELPFPLARQKNSIFEPQEPAGCRYVGYGENSLGIILLPVAKNSPPLVVGNQLDRFTIVYDDSTSDGSQPSPSSKMIGDEKISPDGYKFVFKPLSVHEKTSTKSSEL